VPDDEDNCPEVPNHNQGDKDQDGIGNACDPCTDRDGDGLGDPGFEANTCDLDNCPKVSNPEQLDADSDGKGNPCDKCTDTDGDGLGNPGFDQNTCQRDNCPREANPDQADADTDGKGDLCDPCTDTDGDGYGDPGYGANTCETDNCPSISNPDQSAGACCDVPAISPADCGPSVDLANRAFCAAYPLTVEATADCGDNCASVADAVCQDNFNWFRVRARAKRILKIVPSPGGNRVTMKVFQAAVPEPGGEQDLVEVENPWGSAQDFHRYFVIDGPKDEPVDFWVRVSSTKKKHEYTLTVTETEDSVDCVGMRLTARGRSYWTPYPDHEMELSGFVGGLQSWVDGGDNRYDGRPGYLATDSEGCLKELADDSDPSKGWKTMQVVRCVEGELQVVWDCLEDFPDWDAEKREQYGQLVCNANGHPGGQMWCEPTSITSDSMGICELHDVTRTRPKCLSDPLTGHPGWVFGCQSNYGYLFEQDPALFNPHGVEEGGYFTGQGCNDIYIEGRVSHTEGEAERGRCGTNPLTGKEGVCLFDREQNVAAEQPEPEVFDTSPAWSDFPYTQNFVSCGNPGEGNRVPYVHLDPFSGIYTDAHVAAFTPEMQAILSKGLSAWGYAPLLNPEGNTSLGDHLGSNSTWSKKGYQYVFWAHALADYLGEPGWDYAPFETGCFDADGDLVHNGVDNCPSVYNPPVDGRQPDRETDERGVVVGDGYGDACDPEPDTRDDHDADGDGFENLDTLNIGYIDDNCPLVNNPGQEDSDRNGIGDACQDKAVLEDGSEVVITCDATAGVACMNSDGGSGSGWALSWTFDLARPLAQDLIIAFAKLGAKLGFSGFTWDIATMGDCYSDASVEGFRAFVANGCHLERDVSASTDPGDLGRQQACQKMIAEHPGVVDPTFDLRAHVDSMDDYAWQTSKVSRAWAIFKMDVTRAFMARARTELNAWAQSLGRDSFRTFFNQGETTLYNSRSTGDGGVEPLKDVAGSETFIYSGHPTDGSFDCVGIAGGSYPVNRTMELLYDLHGTDGLRFWSWNFPSEVPDDRMLLYGAETLSMGGIYQVPFCAVELNYPLDGYSRPHYSRRLAQAALAPFASDHWDQLNLARRAGQIALYAPQTLAGGCYSSRDFGSAAAAMIYRSLRDLQYTFDVLGRGSFGVGNARPPTTDELGRYDFVVIAHQFLGDAELAALQEYVEGGGTLVLVGKIGLYDEWCANRAADRGDWLNLIDGFGARASGQGRVIQLEGSTAVAEQVAWTSPGGQAMGAVEAFRYLDAPNSGVVRCENPGGSFSGDPLELEDVAGARTELRAWLEAALASQGLATPAFGVSLPGTIHVAIGDDAQGLPVYHLVNYDLVSVPHEIFYDGERAGASNYTERVAHFGCTVAADLPALQLPVPAEVAAAGGVLHAAALDYEAPTEDFFPNQAYPASPCHSEPLVGAEWPSASNDWAWPTWEVPIAQGEDTVFLDGARIKQWLVLWFEVAN